MMTRKRRRPVPPRTGTAHAREREEKNEPGEHKVERIIGLSGVLLALFLGFDQVQSHRGTLTSGLIFGLASVSIAALLAAALTRKLPNRIRHSLNGVGFACVVAAGVILVLPSHAPKQDATASSSPSISSPALTPDKLLWELTAPDESQTCTHGGMIIPPGGNATSPTPGTFALTPGSQLSVLLESGQPSEIVVTHIKTIVDRPVSQPPGRFVNITPHCQGAPDERFYLADLAGNGGDVMPRSSGPTPRAKLPPLTVSSEDPVSVYIQTPPVSRALEWHIQLTWVVNGQQKITEIYDHGKKLIASPRAGT
jgi:hypothetical protein